MSNDWYFKHGVFYLLQQKRKMTNYTTFIWDGSIWDVHPPHSEGKILEKFSYERCQICYY